VPDAMYCEATRPLPAAAAPTTMNSAIVATLTIAKPVFESAVVAHLTQVDGKQHRGKTS